MNINSSVISQAPMGLTGGGSVELPEIVLPTISMRMPMIAVAAAGGLDLRGVEGSTFASRTINQGASSGVISSNIAVLDKGVYHIVGGMTATVFVGPAASSASPIVGQVELLTPQATAVGLLARCPLCAPGVAFYVPFDVTVFLTQANWTLRLSSYVSTGVGESIGITAWSTISRLL